MSAPDPTILRLSPTTLTNFQSCKLRGFVDAIDRPRTESIYGAVGTAIHTVIHQINLGQKLSPEARVKLLRSEIRKECIEAEIDMSFPPSYHKSLDFIQTYEIPDGWEFLQGEVKREVVYDFATPLPGARFKKYRLGYLLDALFADHTKAEETLAIVDYKSKAQAPSSSLQLDLYAVGEVARTPEAGYQHFDVYYYMTRDGGRLINKKGTPERYQGTADYMALVAETIRLYDAIGQKPEPTPGDCKFCSLYECPVGVG